MAVDLLDAPLRVSWDLFSATDACLTSTQLLKIATDLTESGVFFVTLDNRPLNHPAILQVVQVLLDGGCQVSLVTDGDTQQFSRLDELPREVNLFLDGAGSVAGNRLDRLKLSTQIQQLRSLRFAPSLLWLPRSGQLPLILDFIEFCEQNGVTRFKLPNQKIDVSSEAFAGRFLPDCGDLKQFSALLTQSGCPQKNALQLEVHDLFLWELLQPLCGGERIEYGGCQAANSLGHINAQGQLLPCSSWPQPLGSMLSDNLLDLWQTRARLDVRQQIDSVPVGCDDCRDYSICFGGCRGLATFCRNDGLGRDLLCADRR